MGKYKKMEQEKLKKLKQKLRSIDSKQLQAIRREIDEILGERNSLINYF